MTIEELKEKMVVLREEANAITAKADAEERSLTDDEISEADEKITEFKRLQSEVETRSSLEDAEGYLAKSEGRKADPVQPVNPSDDEIEPGVEVRRRVTGGAFRNDDKARWGWRSIGEQASAIANACNPLKRHLDKRLETRAPTTYASESVGADGGFAVAPAFATEILERISGEESLLSRTSTITTESNSWQQPTDEVAPWDNSSGIRCFWEGEGDQITQSKPVLKKQTVDLDYLTALVPVTQQNLEDAAGLGSYLQRAAPRKMAFQVSLAIVQGTGAGQPLGILNSGATISVAKVGSQVADTLVGQNIVDMWARMYAPSRANSVWLINQDVEPQLDTLMIQGKLNTGAAATGWGGILYMPANGLAGGGFATLKGRPVIPTQACNTIGDNGDIILADLGEYMSLQKTGGIQADTSVHLFFDYNMTAFRFIFRIGGRPWWSAPVSPRSGSNTLSPFVTLAARA